LVHRKLPKAMLDLFAELHGRKSAVTEDPGKANVLCLAGHRYRQMD
jgi:hypothetical protein